MTRLSAKPLHHGMEITPRCRAALNYAKESPPRFGHAHVSTAHLVLGLLTLQGGVADGLLRKFGLSVQSVENYLTLRPGSVGEGTVQDGVPLSGSALAAFSRAEAEAQKMQNTYLGIEHLLLGILAEKSGEATDLFASAQIDREKLKQMIIAQIS